MLNLAEALTEIESVLKSSLCRQKTQTVRDGKGLSLDIALGETAASPEGIATTTSLSRE